MARRRRMTLTRTRTWRGCWTWLSSGCSADSADWHTQVPRRPDRFLVAPVAACAANTGPGTRLWLPRSNPCRRRTQLSDQGPADRMAEALSYLSRLQTGLVWQRNLCAALLDAFPDKSDHAYTSLSHTRLRGPRCQQAYRLRVAVASRRSRAFLVKQA